MDGVGSDRGDVSHPVDGVVQTRAHNNFRRNLMFGAVGIAAIVGVAAPAIYFTTFSADQAKEPLVAAGAEAPEVESSEKAAALVMPAPKKVTIQKITTTQPRAARLQAAASGAELTLLTENDPRWARVDAAGHNADGGSEALPEPVETAELRAKLEQLRDTGDAAPRPTEVATVEPATERKPATDATLTGTIPSRTDAELEQPKVEPAAGETGAPAQADEQLAAVSAPPASTPVAPAAEPSDDLRTVEVTTHVNMRAGPENEAAVLTVLPIGTDVKLIGCDMWCEVDFEGKRGFVYKSFISGS